MLEQQKRFLRLLEELNALHLRFPPSSFSSSWNISQRLFDRCSRSDCFHSIIFAAKVYHFIQIQQLYVWFFQGIKDETTTVPEYLTQVFSEYVLLKLGMDSRRCKIQSKKLAKLINEGAQVNFIPFSKKF